MQLSRIRRAKQKKMHYQNYRLLEHINQNYLYELRMKRIKQICKIGSYILNKNQR